MVLATAIYCTWVDEMTDVVALPKPKFTTRGALWVPPGVNSEPANPLANIASRNA